MHHVSCFFEHRAPSAGSFEVLQTVEFFLRTLFCGSIKETCDWDYIQSERYISFSSYGESRLKGGLVWYVNKKTYNYISHVHPSLSSYTPSNVIGPNYLIQPMRFVDTVSRLWRQWPLLEYLVRRSQWRRLYVASLSSLCLNSVDCTVF